MKTEHGLRPGIAKLRRGPKEPRCPDIVTVAKGNSTRRR
jgi:hypothetical protein